MRTPPRILIVDDEPINLDILQTRLGVHGYEVLTATNGEEALSTAKTQQPDLILLDIMMPKMSGFEVCRHLKSNPETRDIFVVMITALNETGDIERDTECSADDYLTKPVDRQALVKLVRTMLEARQMD